MLSIKKSIGARIILSLFIGLSTIAETLLVVEDPSNPKIIDGVDAISNEGALFLLTRWLSDQKASKDTTYILESRKIGDLEVLNWSRNLSELREVREMFESVEHFLVGGSIWHVLPGKDSLYLLLNRPAHVTGLPPMPSVLYKLDRTGDIVIDRVLELGEKGDLYLYLERIVNLDLHSRGLIVSFGYGITILNDQDLSEIASWHFKEINLDEPQHFNVVLATHIDNNEMFLLGATIRRGDDQTPIWVKKLSLYPTLALLDEVGVTTANYYKIDKFNLTLYGDIIAVVGVDNESNWIVCESSKLETFSCQEIAFPQEISSTFNEQGFWYRISPSIIELSDGYMWTMQWRLSGMLVGERSSHGIEIHHYKPELDRHTFIGEPYLFTMGNKEPFILISQGQQFDNYRYPSVRIRKISK